MLVVHLKNKKRQNRRPSVICPRYYSLFLDYFSGHILAKIFSIQFQTHKKSNINNNNNSKNAPKATNRSKNNNNNWLILSNLFRSGSQPYTESHAPLVWSCLNSTDSRDNQRCPQNKTLLRNHHHHQHHEPRQHVCWKRRRHERKSRHLHFNNQFPTARRGRGQLFVVVLLQAQQPIDVRLFKHASFFYSLPIYLSMFSLSCIFLSLHPMFGEKQAGQSPKGYKVSAACWSQKMYATNARLDLRGIADSCRASSSTVRK